jgi:SAM-dependent methyltransferase
MESYGASFSELYDVFYAEKPYAAEAAFIDAIIRRRLGAGPLRLLELACGTGSHAFAFERLGYQVTATDISEDMIRVARRKAAERRSSVNFSVSDMCSAGEADGAYDAVVCLFDSIGYLLENERIVSCLRNAARRLQPRGICFVESWHAAAMLTGRDPVRVRRWKIPGAEVVRISESSCDHGAQNCLVRFEVIVTQSDGAWRRFEERHRNRYFLRKEMDGLLQSAGLRPLACHPDYVDTAELTDKSWHLVHVAEPA